MDNSKNRQNENLGVNKLGKNIRKSPLHQPNYGSNNGSSGSGGGGARPQQPQPQVYNISKNDFRDIVQQLTGSPAPHQDPPSRPAQNSPKPQSMRLQKIRPPPLSHVRPPLPVPNPANNNNHNTSLHTHPQPQFRQPPPNPMPAAGDMSLGNVAESPISAYMRYLQHSMMDPGSRGNQGQLQPHPYYAPQPHPYYAPQPHPYPPQSQPQPQVPNTIQPYPPSSALLPNPPVPMLPSPRFNGHGPPVPANATNPHVPSIPSPQPNGPPILPSPTSQFLLPSPTGYMNFLSPHSPYPLLSPGFQFPSPLTPNFPFSPFGQSGILGPGPQPPLSPGLFPISPSGFFPITSPRR